MKLHIADNLTLPLDVVTQPQKAYALNNLGIRLTKGRVVVGFASGVRCSRGHTSRLSVLS
jgi:hypothetical protein